MLKTGTLFHRKIADIDNKPLDVQKYIVKKEEMDLAVCLPLFADSEHPGRESDEHHPVSYK